MTTVPKATYSTGIQSYVTDPDLWSQNSLNATIDSSGLFSAGSVISNQVVTITATYGGMSQTKSVTIQDVPETPVSLAITGPDAFVEIRSAEYCCIATFADESSSDMTLDVDWSENRTYTTINNGLLSINEDIYEEKTVQITASYDGIIYAYKTVTIKPVVDYNTWSSLEGLLWSDDNDAPDDTPANDGIQNLLKYACGLPALSDCSTSNLMTIAYDNSNGVFSVNYKYSLSAGADAVTLEAVRATSLNVPSNEWIIDDITYDVTGDDGLYEYRKASISLGGRGFIRLRATQPPSGGID
jgi:hypothetical protein